MPRGSPRVASQSVSNRPIWLVEAAGRSSPSRPTMARMAGSRASRSASLTSFGNGPLGVKSPSRFVQLQELCDHLTLASLFDLAATASSSRPTVRRAPRAAQGKVGQWAAVQRWPCPGRARRDAAASRVVAG